MKSIIEGLLFISGDEGLTVAELVSILEERTDVIVAAISGLKQEMVEQRRGLQIVEIAGAYQLTTIPDHAPYLERLATSPLRTSLSQASLETLSIIAYRQPITRVMIEEIRGVKSDRALHTLVSKDLIQEVGRAETIGRPILYGTTNMFLHYFGLRSLDDLPELPMVSDGDLENETRMLFDRLNKQMTIDDLPNSASTVTDLLSAIDAPDVAEPSDAARSSAAGVAEVADSSGDSESAAESSDASESTASTESAAGSANTSDVADSADEPDLSDLPDIFDTSDVSDDSE